MIELCSHHQQQQLHHPKRRTMHTMMMIIIMFDTTKMRWGVGVEVRGVWEEKKTRNELSAWNATRRGSCMVLQVSTKTIFRDGRRQHILCVYARERARAMTIAYRTSILIDIFFLLRFDITRCKFFIMVIIIIIIIIIVGRSLVFIPL
jgi:hypothetical protein